MNRWFGLLLLFGTVLITRLVLHGPVPDRAADGTMVLGFVLVLSFFAGRVAAAWKVPSITGYIFTGVLFGPHLMPLLLPRVTVLTESSVAALHLLDGAALGLIALTAGGELRLSMIRQRKRGIVAIIVSHVLVITTSVGGLTYLSRSLLPGLTDLPGDLAVAAALLLGITAVAKSPATTIAVIQEYQPRGPLTEMVLAVTVAKDVVIVTLFTVALAFAIQLVEPGRSFALHNWLELGWEVFGSILVGLTLGWALAFYARRVGHEMPLVVLAIAFLSGALSSGAQLSGLMVCMVAGFFVENFSQHGDDLIKAVERHSMVLYIVFFTISGAAIDLPALQRSWLLTVMLVAARLLFTFLATYLGARTAGETRAVCLHAWSGFIGQAGVTLGFASLIAQRLPRIGPLLRTVVTAAVAVNQIIGPVLFRLGLAWAGEIADPTASNPFARDDSGPLRRGATGSPRPGDTGPIRRGDSGPIRRGDSGPIRRGDSGPIRRGDSGPIRRGDTLPPRRRADTLPPRRGPGDDSQPR